MGDGTHLESGEAAQRHGGRPWLLLGLVLVIAPAAALLLGVWKPLSLSPPARVHYDGREYSRGGSWSGYQERFPGAVPDASDLEPAGDDGLLVKDIRVSPVPPGGRGATHTVICVQALDGSYWAYSLVGGP